MTFSLFGRRQALAAFALMIPGLPAFAVDAPGGPPATAEQPATPAPLTFTVESAVAHALAHNRDLLAASRLVEEAQGRLDGAGRPANPELEIGGGPGLYASHTGVFDATLRQRFPVTSRLRHESEVARAELDAAREEILVARRKLIAEVKSDAIRLLSLRERTELLTRRAKIARELADSAAGRVRRGEAGAIEAGFLELETGDLADTLARADAERAALLATFRARLGLAPDVPAEMAGIIPAEPDTLGAPSPDESPDCRRARFLVEASESSVKLEQDRKYDDITVGVFGQLEHSINSPGSPQNLGYAGLRVTIPLPLWNDNSGAIRTARARRERLRGEYAAETLRLQAEATSARREFALLSRRLPDVKDRLIPAARRQADLARTALARGEGVPSDLYRALDKLTDFELRETDLRRDIALARVRLESALGAHPALREPANASGDTTTNL